MALAISFTERLVYALQGILDLRIYSLPFCHFFLLCLPVLRFRPLVFPSNIR